MKNTFLIDQTFLISLLLIILLYCFSPHGHVFNWKYFCLSPLFFLNIFHFYTIKKKCVNWFQFYFHFPSMRIWEFWNVNVYEENLQNDVLAEKTWRNHKTGISMEVCRQIKKKRKKKAGWEPRRIKTSWDSSQSCPRRSKKEGSEWLFPSIILVNSLYLSWYQIMK